MLNYQRVQSVANNQHLRGKTVATLPLVLSTSHWIFGSFISYTGVLPTPLRGGKTGWIKLQEDV
jgi:hypothetical protein